MSKKQKSPQKRGTFQEQLKASLKQRAIHQKLEAAKSHTTGKLRTRAESDKEFQAKQQAKTSGLVTVAAKAKKNDLVRAQARVAPKVQDHPKSLQKLAPPAAIPFRKLLQVKSRCGHMEAIEFAVLPEGSTDPAGILHTEANTLNRAEKVYSQRVCFFCFQKSHPGALFDFYLI